MPLWDNDIEYLFCRDIDSIPCSLEARAVRTFINHKEFYISSIRSHPLHTISLMAGLCGFYVPKIKNILPSNFDDYISFGKKNCPYCSDWRWGCDQELLDRFFVKTRDNNFIKHILDIPVQNSIGEVKSMRSIGSSILPKNIYNTCDLSNINEKVLYLCDSNYGKFVGMPLEESWGYKKENKIYLLNEILSINADITNMMKEFFDKYKNIKEYFGVI